MGKDSTSVASKTAAARLDRPRKHSGGGNHNERTDSKSSAATLSAAAPSAADAKAHSGPRPSSAALGSGKVGWGKVKIAAAQVTTDGQSMNLGKAAKAAMLKQAVEKSKANAEKEARLKFEQENAVNMLTDFQIEEFREAFRVFDVDGSGNIDKDELKKLMLSVGQTPGDDELDEMVRIADADGSGEVDFYEFVALMAHKMADPSNDDAVSQAFDLFDRDGDHMLDVNELRSLMMNVGEAATWGDIQTLISEVDINGDGAINVDEFTKMVLHDQQMAQLKQDTKAPRSPAQKRRLRKHHT